MSKPQSSAKSFTKDTKEKSNVVERIYVFWIVFTLCDFKVFVKQK